MVGVIGNFDGVHRGHQYLLQIAKTEAQRRNTLLVTISFDILPSSILHPESNTLCLMSSDEKVSILSTLVDKVQIYHFDRTLASKTAEEFLSILKEDLNLDCLLLGYDNYFGSDRLRSLEDYREIGNRLGVEILQVTESVYSSSTQNDLISSSNIRQALLDGKVAKAMDLLGRPYSLRGEIVSGEHIGRTLGYPTANIKPLDTNKLVPKDGVYSVLIAIGQLRYKGMLYIGNRPTIGEQLMRTIEVNIFDLTADLYTQQVEVFFISYIRGNQKFSSVEDLRIQIGRDKESVLAALSYYSN